LYETEECETPQTQSIDKTQPVITDDNFENKLKNIIDDNSEDNKSDDKNKSDNQQYEPSFKLVSRRRK
jgi:hypothetical protein